MKNLPIELLRAFVTVIDEGGFTAAAERLGRTQPAVSQQIKKLESLLDRPLLNRDSPRPETTVAGDALMNFARQMLALNDEAVGYFAHPPVSGRIRFGIPSEFAITLLPKIVSRFARAYPDVTLEVTCDLSRNLVAEAQRHRYDLVLALHDNMSPAKARRIENFVRSDQLVWVSSSASRAHQQETLPLVAAPSGCIYRARALRCLGESKRRCRIVYTIPDLTGIQAAIEEGIGVTVLARSTVPAGMVVLDSSAGLPDLGNIGISLQTPDAGTNTAVKVLADFIKAGLL